MKTLTFCLAAIFFLPVFNSFAGVNKCNVNGRILFTDKPCAEDSESKVLEIPNQPSSGNKKQQGVPSNWLVGYKGYTEALELSRKIDAPIFVYFKADWCNYCKKLERELLNTTMGKDALSDVIKVRIKPEESTANDSFFKKNGGSGYPTILVQKSYSSAPVKRYLMVKKSGEWKTRGAEYLEKLLAVQ